LKGSPIKNYELSNNKEGVLNEIVKFEFEPYHVTDLITLHSENEFSNKGAKVDKLRFPKPILSVELTELLTNKFPI